MSNGCLRELGDRKLPCLPQIVETKLGLVWPYKVEQRNYQVSLPEYLLHRIEDWWTDKAELGGLCRRRKIHELSRVERTNGDRAKPAPEQWVDENGRQVGL